MEFTVSAKGGSVSDGHSSQFTVNWVIRVILISILSFSLFLVPLSVGAEGEEAAQTLQQTLVGEGTQTKVVLDTLGAQPTHPAQIVKKILQVAVGFIGIIVVGLLMYGGFLWMTASGDSKDVEKAQGIIHHTIVGAIIVLAAWSIAYFVVKSILGSVQS